ncbi:MAG: hypothetical protein Q9207_007677 [Kuettlingeria erythrocarpa]
MDKAFGYTGASTTPPPSFVEILQRFNQDSSISIADSGCKGLCSAQLRGAGLVANCSTSDAPFILALPDGSTGEEHDQAYRKTSAGTYIFGTYLSPYGDGLFDSGVQYKATKDCLGTLVVQNCTFQTATVTYPVSINGNTSSISLAAGTTIFDDTVDLDVMQVQFERTSTYRGFLKYLETIYTSSMLMEEVSMAFISPPKGFAK